MLENYLLVNSKLCKNFYFSHLSVLIRQILVPFHSGNEPFFFVVFICFSLKYFFAQFLQKAIKDILMNMATVVFQLLLFVFVISYILQLTKILSEVFVKKLPLSIAIMGLLQTQHGVQRQRDYLLIYFWFSYSRSMFMVNSEMELTRVCTIGLFKLQNFTWLEFRHAELLLVWPQGKLT